MSAERKKEECALRIMEALSGVDEALLDRCGGTGDVRDKRPGRVFGKKLAGGGRGFSVHGDESGENASGKRARGIPWRSLGACAAALCLAVTGAAGWWGYQMRNGFDAGDGYSGGACRQGMETVFDGDFDGAETLATGENGASGQGAEEYCREGDQAAGDEVQKDYMGPEILSNSQNGINQSGGPAAEGADKEGLESSFVEKRESDGSESAALKLNAVEYGEEEARELEGLGAYIPTALPRGYVFERAYVNQDLKEENVTVCWIRGMDIIVIQLKTAGEAVSAVDVEKPETYDERLYEIPYGETVPEEYRQIFQDPVFALEDFSLEVVESRMLVYEDGGDTATPRGNFKVLYPEGVLASFNGRGTAQEIWDMFSSMNPQGSAAD